MLHVSDQIAIPLTELQFTYARSSGPGGQNVNKVNSKAVMHWPALKSPSLPDDVRGRFVAKYASRITVDGQIVITSQRFRDQGRNIADCLEKLREMIVAVMTPPKIRRKKKVTRASKEKRLKEKRIQSDRKSGRRNIKSDE